LPSATEEPSGPAAPPRLELIDRPRLRTWFQSSDGTQLLQIQHDRIAYNWKRGPDSHPYPSYDEVERQFLELLPIFIDFVDREGLGQVVPTQAEVTYVNHISEPHDQIGRVITLWRGLDMGGFLPPVEGAQFLARYLIVDDAKNMVGRLTAQLQPAYVTSTRAEILNLNMIARGRPKSSDIDGAIAFLRLGHEWIVRGFAEITTPEMHAKWERTQ
ncbi:MAG: TIGR04255 family protein, partial [Phycisphaerales bacterium]|nr:TIGR04255 family protein [Phycisphaerales bacterium]